MQIPIFNGVFTDAAGDFRVSYPVNLVPVITGEKGLGIGYLRPVEGIVQSGMGPGASRGGINFRGVVYRAMGSRLISIDGNNTITDLLELSGTGRVTFDYSFDRLAVCAGMNVSFIVPPREIVFNNGIAVPMPGSNFIIASTGQFHITTDGTDWQRTTPPISAAANDLTWNGVIFCTVTSSTTQILTSPDAVSWTTRPVSGLTNHLLSVVWNGSMFCAVGLQNAMVTSTDGITWVTRNPRGTVMVWNVGLSTWELNPNPSSSVFQLSSVVFAGGQWVAVGEQQSDARISIVVSIDGVNWTAWVWTNTVSINACAWNGSVLCAVGFNGAIFTSSDFRRWVQQSSATSQPLRKIVWNGLIFCAVGNNGTIIISPDGRSWSSRISGVTNDITGLTWNGSMFCATVHDSNVNNVLFSTDGVTWTVRTSPNTMSSPVVGWGVRNRSTEVVVITDTNLINPIDLVWIDGYFAITDGRHVVVTDLNDPTRVNPLRYGSSEVDPDPIVAVEKLRNELHVINRHTIEVFRNTGGQFFPFQRIEGAMIPKGAIATHAVCVFGKSLALLGSGRNEPLSIWLAADASAVRISTREIDTVLRQFTEQQLSDAVLESRMDRDHEHLWVRLPDRTLVYDLNASRIAEEPVWYTMVSALDGFSAYRARDLVWCYDKWTVGDGIDGRFGVLDDKISTQYSNHVRWEFGTLIMYNRGDGAIIHGLELVALTGRVAAGTDPMISTSHSIDGTTWTADRFIRAGITGDRLKRLVWLQQGFVRNWRVQRFRGTSEAYMSFARLQAKVEALRS